MGAGKQWNDIVKVLKENINYHPRILHSAKTTLQKGFPGGSGGKESACNAGDQDLIPGWGRSHREGNGYPLLGGEDPIEKGTATHSSILAWRIPWTKEPGGLQSMGSQRVGHD